MKKRFLLVYLAVGICPLVPGALTAQTPVPEQGITGVSMIEAQEFARALAQLKVQEVALQRAVPSDERALDLNHAQQAKLELELNRIAAMQASAKLQRLEAERDDYAKDLMPKHPKMIALQAEIDQTKAALAAGH